MSGFLLTRSDSGWGNPKNPPTACGESRCYMAEEKTDAEIAAAEAEAKAEEEQANADFEASLEGLSEEEKAEKIAAREAEKESQKESHIDWKKVAEDEKEKRKKAEDKLAGKRFKSSKKKEGSEDDEEYEEKPLTESLLKEILAEDRKENQKEFLSSKVKEAARELAESDDEVEAIVAIFNNRSFPSSMSLEDQVQEAYFIAHGPRLLAKRNELRRSLKSKETKKKSGDEDTHIDGPKGGEPKVSAQDRAEMERLGFTWDGKNYSKRLASGKTLIKDWKTKKVFISKTAK